MKAMDVQTYLQSLSGDWEYPANTVDTFKAGDPQSEVSGIAVGWMSYTWALKRALELGCNVFITHEPTYYDHHDNDPDVMRLKQVHQKRQFIEKSGLVIIRCHDLWDQIREVGIPDSWGGLLEFGQAVDGTEHLRIYEMENTPARQLAAHVAARTAEFGQPGVQLIGPAEKPVRRVSIGTGAITPYLTCVEDFDVDLAICTDDGIDYWRDGGFAIDMGIPIIVVNHMVAEEIGVMSLARQLTSQFPAIPIQHIPQRCMYEHIVA